MKNTVTAPAPGPGAETEALIREARRRQLITGLAAAGVLASGLGAFAGLRGTGQPPAARPPAGRPRPGPAARHPAAPRAAGLIPRSTGSTVLMWPAGSGQAPWGIYLDNLRTRRLRQASTPSVDQCRSRRVPAADADGPLARLRPGRQGPGRSR